MKPGSLSCVEHPSHHRQRLSRGSVHPLGATSGQPWAGSVGTQMTKDPSSGSLAASGGERGREEYAQLAQMRAERGKMNSARGI